MSKSKQASQQREHRAVEGMLSAYLDGMLAPKERVRVEHHLRFCPTCTHNLSTLRHTVGLLRAMPAVPVPRAFTIRAPVEARRTRPAWGLGLLQAATAVAALMLIFVLVGDVWLGGLELGRPERQLSSQPAPPVVQAVEVTREVEKAVAVVEEPAAEPGTAVAMAPGLAATATLTPAPAEVSEGVRVEPTPEPVSLPTEAPAAAGGEATMPAAAIPQTRTSEIAVAADAAPTEPVAAGLGGEPAEEPPEVPAPAAEAEEALAAVEAAPTEAAVEATMPAPTPLPEVVEAPRELPEAQATAAVALVPEASSERVPVGEPKVVQREPPIDWLTVIEIGLAVLVVLMGSVTLLVSLLRRRSS